MSSAEDLEKPRPNGAPEIISDLEQRYIKLLESRIAHLEAQLGTTKDSNAKDKLPDGMKNEQPPKEDGEGAPAPKESEKAEAKEDVENPVKEGDDTPPKRKKTRHVLVIREWDDNKMEFVDKTPDVSEETKSPTKTEHAFTFIKLKGPRLTYRGPDSSPTRSSAVEIHSEPLQRLLGKITEKWEGKETMLELQHPFKPLIYSWSEAEEEAEKAIDDEAEDEKQARRDLRELLNIISTSSGIEKLDQYFKDRETFLKDKTIRHYALWTLFPPGSLIFGRPFLGQPQIFFVETCSGFTGTSDSKDPEPFKLYGYSFDWNGSEFNRVQFELDIPHWAENQKKNVVELPYYPLNCYQEANMSPEDSLDKLKRKLVARGKKYREACIGNRKGTSMFRYDGPAYFQKGSGIFQSQPSGADGDNQSHNSDAPASKNLGTDKIQIKGAVIVDFKSYYNYQASTAPVMGELRKWEGDVECNCPDCLANESLKKLYRFDWDRHPPWKDMDESQYLLCPPRVLGYGLEQKKWLQFLVNDLKKPDDPSTTTFHKQLQLHRDYKDLIEKSVRAHETGKAKGIEDFTPGKGKGLVILLYGLPGVGKTLTAESVAMLAGKPLFSVGVSDIGIEGAKVESNLQKVFDLAGLWEAVLLFDEADVFLEARGSGENDMMRNAMVSVLLRVLEYYEGILILTTNRLKSFDIAVQSRVHLAIKYEDLSKEQRISIFSSFVEQLRAKNLVDDFRDIEDWVERQGCRCDFNGRQIRNVVSTAISIANAENGKLTRDHLSLVARQTEDFQKDLHSQEVLYRSSQMSRR